MSICDGFVGAVGNTPLIRLPRLSEETGCEILGKAEFMNPGGSVKDRAALVIIQAAERSGELRPGGTVVEGTAGNTGIGLAHICNARGYRCVIVIPETQSQEKIDLLRTLGAEVHTVPAAPYRDPANYQKVAGRMAAEMDNAVWANQFDNTANRQGHYRTTGPEIWAQAGGRVDAFVAATGTGGTLAGVSRALKERAPDTRIYLADPAGSALYSFVREGEPSPSAGNSITEGIGSSRVTANLQDTDIDDAFCIPDTESVPMVYRLLREEGLFLGSSSGVNVCGAIRAAEELGPGHTVVTILCDGGGRYYSRLFNEAWLAERGLA
ncbi:MULTISPECIES: cysteine synthase A [unclassified Halorhodospira]|uniref:cysteine synthase A n=1 Tax=unclassified Halorhodospira TaxID=2626748 RepID=UPI001EE8654B|nr:MULTISPECIES: cysteine synthase A [unclassified Halorhodospira]MCG5539680.1 cysteine synthase A [Halorhodospira sp. M39old]MCG5545490.1 cysteine synthase A [Halorhodospira sp. M38]